MTRSELRELILPFGDPRSVHIGVTTRQGMAVTFGFAEVMNEGHARAALAGLGGRELGGRSIAVSEVPFA